MSILIKLVEEDYGVEQEGASGRWYRSKTHSSLVVDSERDLFYFGSLGINGNAYIYLTKVREWEHSKALSYLKQFNNYTDSFILNIRNKEEVVAYPALVDVFWEDGIRLNKFEYWDARGISKNTVNRFRLGYYQQRDFYTIPLYMDGLFRNFQLRKDYPKKDIRSYYSGVGRLLFNSDILKLTDRIIITEGLTSCLRLMQEGVPCVSHNAGANGWDIKWFKYFCQQDTIYILYDNDAPGNQGAKEVARNLGIYRARIYTFSDQDKGYDVADFLNDGNSGKDLLHLIEKESKYAFEME